MIISDMSLLIMQQIAFAWSNWASDLLGVACMSTNDVMIRKEIVRRQKGIRVTCSAHSFTLKLSSSLDTYADVYFHTTY